MTTLAVQPDSLRASLIDALGGPEPERALEQAFLQLARCGELPLVLAMLKALVRVGLAGIAVRLLQSAGGLLTAEPQLAALADQLAVMPQGEVPHAILTTRFTNNLRVLLPSRPHLNQSVNRWTASLDAVRVFASVAGNMHAIRDSSDDRRLDLIFPFADQIGQARALKLPELSMTSSYLLVGVPSSALFARLLLLATASGYQPPIDIIETEVDVAGLWLHMIENASAFADERVNLFVGETAVEQYREFLTNHPWRRPATHCTTNFRPRWTPPQINGRFHESVAAVINERHKCAIEALEQQTAARDATYWSNRFQQAMEQGLSLRIAGFTTRFSTVIQHSMRDLAAAFERRGHVFDVIMQPKSSCAHVDVVGALSKHDYDLIVVIDHLRNEFAGTIPRTIPFVCWIQDHMDALYTNDAGRSVTNLDVVIGHSPGLMHCAYGYPLERFIASSNLTDPHTYSDVRLPESELAPHRCDVSYVGHGSATPMQLVDEIGAQAPESFRRCLQSFVELAQPPFEQQGWLSFADRMELALQAERESGHPAMAPALRRRILLPALDRLFDRMVRHQSLDWTANWARSRSRTFRLYGRGWDRHPTLAGFAAGEIANGRPLRSVYQASAVSLQITGYSSLHQRLLDGICSGALMMARFNPFDFLRQPHAIIRRFILQADVSTLPELLALARTEPELSEALERLHAFGHARIAPGDDPLRRREAALYREVFDAPPESLTDSARFDALASGRFIPNRSACDLPGFDSLTFRSEVQLQKLLDRLVGNGEERERLVKPMHESVLANDTHDSLVQRILQKFTGE